MDMDVTRLEVHLEILGGPAIRAVRAHHVEEIRRYIIGLHEQIRAHGRAQQLWAEELEAVRRERDQLTAALAAAQTAELARERARHLAANRVLEPRGEVMDPVSYTRPYLPKDDSTPGGKA